MPITSFGQVIPVTGPNVGFPGTVSRIGDRIITARVFTPNTASNVLNFGDPAVLVGNATNGYFDSIADYIAAGVANVAKLPSMFAGAAVREVKSQLTYGNGVTPGVQQLGFYSSGQMSEVLERGSITVNLAVGTPSAGAQVYVRIVANAGVPAGVVGDWECSPAASDLFSVATTTTQGSTAATVASGSNIQVGQLITGLGVATGTYVAAISGTTLTLSQNAVATFATTGTVLTFSNLFAVPNCSFRTGQLDANNVTEITFESRNVA